MRTIPDLHNTHIMNISGIRSASPGHSSGGTNVHHYSNGYSVRPHFSGYPHQVHQMPHQFRPLVPNMRPQPSWNGSSHTIYDSPTNYSTPERASPETPPGTHNNHFDVRSPPGMAPFHQNNIYGAHHSYPPAYSYHPTIFCPCCAPGAPLCPCRQLNLTHSVSTQTDLNVITAGKFTKKDYTEAGNEANIMLKVSITIQNLLRRRVDADSNRSRILRIFFLTISP